MIKLNLGSGKDRRSGYIPVDIIDFGDNVVLNIQKEGLKNWKDNSVEKLMAHAFLEHVKQEKVIFVMNECHRVLKIGGIFDILVPRADSPTYSVFSDPTHLSYCWLPCIFEEYFTGKNEESRWYGIKPWKIEKLDCNKKTIRAILTK